MVVVWLVEVSEGVITGEHPLGLSHGVIGLVVIELVVVGQPLGLLHGVVVAVGVTHPLGLVHDDVVVVAGAHPLGLVHDDVVVVGVIHPLGFVHDDVVVGVIHPLGFVHMVVVAVELVVAPQPLGFVHVSVPGVFDDSIEAVVPVSDFTLGGDVISVDLAGAGPIPDSASRSEKFIWDF